MIYPILPLANPLLYEFATASKFSIHSSITALSAFLLNHVCAISYLFAACCLFIFSMSYSVLNLSTNSASCSVLGSYDATSSAVNPSILVESSFIASMYRSTSFLSSIAIAPFTAYISCRYLSKSSRTL